MKFSPLQNAFHCSYFGGLRRHSSLFSASSRTPSKRSFANDYPLRLTDSQRSCNDRERIIAWRWLSHFAELTVSRPTTAPSCFSIGAPSLRASHPRFAHHVLSLAALAQLTKNAPAPLPDPAHVQPQHPSPPPLLPPPHSSQRCTPSYSPT